MNTPSGLASRVAAELGPVLAQYGLAVVAVDPIEALLVGRQYALRFVADREGVEVFYIERDRNGQLDEFGLRTLVMDRFTAEDRARYGQPDGIKERLDASLRVYASGLLNRCQDLLTGEKAWLRREAWRMPRPRAAVEQAVHSAGL